MKIISKVSLPLVLSKEQVLKRQLEDVENDIVKKIESNVLGIPKNIVSFVLIQIPYLCQKNKHEHSQLTVSRLIQERRKLEDKLKDLQMTQKEYTQKSRVKTNISMEASRYTQEEKQNIKKLRKRMKDFEKSIEKKDKQIEQQKKRLVQEQDERDKRQKQAVNKVKKIKIEERLKELKQRVIERQAIKKETDEYVKKVENGQKKYAKMNEQWKERNLLEQQKKYEIMELRMKQKYFDFSGLKQHEKKYQQAILNKKKELQNKRLSASQLIFTENKSMLTLKTRYHYILEEQERQAKEEAEQRKEKHKFLQEKKIQYSQYVRDQFIPKKKEGQQSTLFHRSNSQDIKIPRKTDQEIRQIGNQNLAFGNQKAKKKESFNSTVEEQNNKSNIRLPLYPDYLKQIHKKRSETIQNSPHKSQIINPKKEALKIMNDNCLKSQEKIDLIKLLASRIDEKGQDMVQNIQNKLSILSALR